MTSLVIAPSYRPRLRSNLAAALVAEPDTFGVYDPNRIVPGYVPLSRRELDAVQLFAGDRSIAEIHHVVQLPIARLVDLVTALDSGLLLDTPTFRNYLLGPIRKPSCIGCYSSEPSEIRKQFRELFVGPGGPGLPDFTLPNRGNLRALLVPHMDFNRGGVTYGWGFKELAEQSDASLFVVIATSHYSPHRFTLTRMNFATPLGEVPTDQAYLERLVHHYGPGLFDDPLAHLPEHSVELEVILLQYLLENRRPFRIVPLVVGSFRDCVELKSDPALASDIARMVQALQKAERESSEKVCYIISGDLAHIGPKFDDPEPVAEPFLSHSLKQDTAILERLNAVDTAGYFGVIAAEQDARRICGLPPTWLTLSALQPKSGRVLHYNRYIHPTGHESVSFAAAAFYD